MKLAKVGEKVYAQMEDGMWAEAKAKWHRNGMGRYFWPVLESEDADAITVLDPDGRRRRGVIADAVPDYSRAQKQIETGALICGLPLAETDGALNLMEDVGDVMRQSGPAFVRLRPRPGSKTGCAASGCFRPDRWYVPAPRKAEGNAVELDPEAFRILRAAALQRRLSVEDAACEAARLWAQKETHA